MRYPDGSEAKLGDRLRIFDGDCGYVVASIDTGQYSQEFSKRDWAYLKEGIMVKTDKGALVHLDSSHSDKIARL
jgi:hypothetical protein